MEGRIENGMLSGLTDALAEMFSQERTELWERCDKCGEHVYLGDTYLKFDGILLHEDCAKELMKIAEGEIA